MIKFFRKIRQNLLSEGKTEKYFKYAIGEIVLVVIGILIALSINSWNGNRKLKNASKEIYSNLIKTLRADSTEISKIIKIQSLSIQGMNKIIVTDSERITAELSDDEIIKLVENIQGGASSFFPRYGVYNTIISNKGIDLLKSDNINSLLINLYDYEYKRYQNIDGIVDQKFLFQMWPFINNNIIAFKLDSTSDYGELIRTPDPELFKEHYLEFGNLSKEIVNITDIGLKLLIEIKESINVLINRIEVELKK